jgi:DNA (cytosine-5)-methyltransferase 1
MLLNYINGKTPIIYPNFPYSRYHNTDDVSWMKEAISSISTNYHEIDCKT